MLNCQICPAPNRQGLIEYRKTNSIRNINICVIMLTVDTGAPRMAWCHYNGRQYCWLAWGHSPRIDHMMTTSAFILCDKYLNSRLWEIGVGHVI
jgi:hypothetical protein